MSSMSSAVSLFLFLLLPLLLPELPPLLSFFSFTFSLSLPLPLLIFVLLLVVALVVSGLSDLLGLVALTEEVLVVALVLTFFTTTKSLRLLLGADSAVTGALKRLSKSVLVSAPGSDLNGVEAAEAIRTFKVLPGVALGVFRVLSFDDEAAGVRIPLVAEMGRPASSKSLSCPSAETSAPSISEAVLYLGSAWLPRDNRLVVLTLRLCVRVSSVSTILLLDLLLVISEVASTEVGVNRNCKVATRGENKTSGLARRAATHFAKRGFSNATCYA